MYNNLPSIEGTRTNKYKCHWPLKNLPLSPSQPRMFVRLGLKIAMWKKAQGVTPGEPGEHPLLACKEMTCPENISLTNSRCGGLLSKFFYLLILYYSLANQNTLLKICFTNEVSVRTSRTGSSMLRSPLNRNQNILAFLFCQWSTNLKLTLSRKIKIIDINRNAYN